VSSVQIVIKRNNARHSERLRCLAGDVAGLDPRSVHRTAANLHVDRTGFLCRSFMSIVMVLRAKTGHCTEILDQVGRCAEKDAWMVPRPHVPFAVAHVT